jgi:hypothetical protein
LANSSGLNRLTKWLWQIALLYRHSCRSYKQQLSEELLRCNLQLNCEGGMWPHRCESKSRRLRHSVWIIAWKRSTLDIASGLGSFCWRLQVQVAVQCSTGLFLQ